jgi:D-lactate dehydrogenase (cytochrome)
MASVKSSLVSTSSVACFSSHTAAEAALSALRQDLEVDNDDDNGVETTDNPYERDRHGKGESYHATQPPGLVAYPKSTDAVQRLVQACVRHRIPIVPFGGGTSLEGHVGAPHPYAVSLDTSRYLNQILHLPEMSIPSEIDDTTDVDSSALLPPDPFVIVQAGVTRQQLQQALKPTGWQFTVDPGAGTATLGGMVATNAAGTTTVKYGAMRDNVLGLQAILATDDAALLRTGGTTLKNSAGYDLTRLLCGSEGTLAVLTQATLRVWPVPTVTVAGRWQFKTLTAAGRAVALMRASGVDALVRCEVLDASSVAAFLAYNERQSTSSSTQSHYNDNLALLPTLFLELQGATDAAVQEQVDLVTVLLQEETPHAGEWATDADARTALWKARHSLYYAAMASRPGGGATGALVTDAAVGLSHLPALLEATAADVKAAGLHGPCFGHAGDGSFHCILAVRDDDTPEYWSKVHSVNQRLLERTLAVGGTVTGEHGIGVGKRQYLRQQYGDDTVNAMRLLKKAWDPYNLLNPGKVFTVNPGVGDGIS